MNIDELIEKWREEAIELEKENCLDKAGMADVFVEDLKQLKGDNEQDITFNTNEIEKDVAIRVLAEMVVEK